MAVGMYRRLLDRAPAGARDDVRFEMSEGVEPVSAIYPGEQAARAALRRVRQAGRAEIPCLLLSPEETGKDLRTLHRVVVIPSAMQRRALLMGVLLGGLAGALAGVVALLLNIVGPLEDPLWMVLALVAGGVPLGALGGLWWNRNVALPGSLEPVREALHHGHWSIVALPADPEQSRRIARALEDTPGQRGE
jgi:hypothetical protein